MFSTPPRSVDAVRPSLGSCCARIQTLVALLVALGLAGVAQAHHAPTLVTATAATEIQEPSGVRAAAALPKATQELVDAADQFANLAATGLESQRRVFRERLVGKRFLKNDRLIDVPEAELLAPLAKEEEKLAAARAELAKLREGYTRGEVNRDQLERECYALIVTDLRSHWEGVLHTLRGLVGQLRAEAFSYYQSALAAAQMQANLREPIDRAAVDALAPQYLAARDYLLDHRRSIARLYWGSIREADARIKRPGDAHAIGKRTLLRSLWGSLAHRERGTDSALDFYVSFPGSSDRLILRMPSYPWLAGRFPAIQVRDSPTLWKLDVGGLDPVLSLQEEAPRVQLRWSYDEGTTAEDWSLTDQPDRRVAPLRYRAGRDARLLVCTVGYPLRDLPDQDVDVTVQSSGRVGTLRGKCNFGEDAVGVVTLPAREMLDATRSGVNRNLLEAQVRVRVGEALQAGLTSNRLHILRQSLLLFIPGIFGSEIGVRGSGAPVLAFPTLSKNVVGVQPFTRLLCGRDGQPKPGNDAIQLDLFRRYFTEKIYDIESQPAVMEPMEHPSIMAGGQRLKHYVLQPWPYDWRLRLEGTVDTLLRTTRRTEGGTTVPPYRTPPGIKECLEQLRTANPLIEERVVLIGHSTGGLIARGAIKRAQARDQIDRAFFINVPFWGAPKAYYVFVTGDMGIPFVANGLMRQMAPNAPIVYYLAPTEQYPGDVVTFGRVPVTRQPGRQVGPILTRLVNEAKAMRAYPATGLDPWNASLEASARSFHSAITGEPVIGWDRCRVFWSVSTRPDTAGMVYTDPAKKTVANWKIFGDGTVPRESQRADWPAACLIENPGRPLHVPSPNSPFAWQRIVDELCRPVE